MLGPEVGVASRVDQLNAYTDAITNSLDAAFNNVGNSKGPGNFAEVTSRSARVLHHARATDYLEVRYLAKIGKDFLLHALREVSVLLFLAQVLKRQHRNTFLRHNRLRLRRRSKKTERSERQNRGPQREASGYTCGEPWISARPTPNPDRRRDWPRNNGTAFEPAFKVLCQGSGRAVTGGGFPFQAAHTDCFQVAICQRSKRTQFRRWFFGGFLNHSERVFAEERRPTGE